MTVLRLAAIVEGHGEMEAVPILIRRIAVELDPGLVLRMEIFRVPVSLLLKTGELERRVKIAARKLEGKGAILILLDCDDGCPAKDGPPLLARAREARPDLPIAVVLAKKEYEAWFVAAAESLRGHRGLSDDLVSDPPTGRNQGRKGLAFGAYAKGAALCGNLRSTRPNGAFRHSYRKTSRLV